MKKDIEWLKEWLDEYEDETFNEIGDIRTNGDFGGRLREGLLMRELLAITNVQEKLDQLDEAEVLSQEWIDEYSYNIEEYWEVADMMDKPQYAVSVENLQNLLVPKQELPVIPQFVAEWIDNSKSLGGNIQHDIYNLVTDSYDGEQREINNYIRDNENGIEKLVIAYRHGYEVEEQKYYIRENNYLLCKWKNEVMDYVEAVGREITDLVELKLTEQEIKDYDDRFWPFALKVEELEE